MLLQPGSCGFATAPISVLRADAGDKSLFVLLSGVVGLDEYARSIASCRKSGAEVSECRFLSEKEAMEYIDMMICEVVPGSVYIRNPKWHSWPKVEGRFQRVRQPYLHISKGKARKVRVGCTPNPYPRIAP